MTHLPDCDDYAFSGAGYHPNCERICICRQVRRIERRLLDAAREAIAEQKLVPLAKQGRFIITRNTQLWEKRQAWSELGWWDFRTSALAAIDALKETNVNA